MHTVIRSYRLDEGDIDEVMHLIDTDFADGLPSEPGFVAYEALRIGSDALVTISTFADEAGCERSNEMATAFIRDRLPHMRITRTDLTSGEVAVSRAARKVLEPAHA